MIKVNTQPTSGQFVAVWEYNGQLWSDTYMWKDGELYVYAPDVEDSEDDWLHLRHGHVFAPHQKVMGYFTK